MISEFFLNILFNIVSGIFSQFPDVSWSVSSAGFETFFGLIGSAAYMLPMGTIKTVFTIIVSFTIFKFVVSLIKTIWDILPVL